jgi:hypothetical protein
MDWWLVACWVGKLSVFVGSDGTHAGTHMLQIIERRFKVGALTSTLLGMK